jgi:Kef-type K+ transport system membrane component KefB/mannitol/fructose-specific phosphotransferase system IIA component (Ntr-type)/nucleotide-binding universal stress UspA family protein
MFPVEDPILAFTILAFTMLLAPLLAERLRVPDLVLLLAAGAALGPNGLGVLTRNTAVTMFGTVGLLYIMFLAGLEIDLHRFFQTRRKSVAFGLLTFVIPQGLGTLAGHYVLGMDWRASALLASMFASHTLLAYPIASRLGIARSEPVTITVGATIVTDTLALLVLAVVADSAKGESLGADFWAGILLGMAALVALIWWGIPRLTRWFFMNVTESGGAQFLFVIITVCGCAYLSHFAKLEPIIGAFLAGAAFNRMIPDQSPLMHRVTFAGNTLFIPFFLISVGMLVDPMALLTDPKSWLVAATMVVTVTLTKFAAAWLTQKRYGYTTEAGRVMFGLSVVQAAATLAAVLVGFNLGILDESVLNGAIAMILVTCPLGSWTVARYGRVMAAQDSARTEAPRTEQRMLVPVVNPESATSILDLAFLLRDPAIPGAIYPLTIVGEEGGDDEAVARGEKLLAHCMGHAASADIPVSPSVRVGFNVSDAIIRAARELRAGLVLAGWGGEHSASARVFGSVSSRLMETCPSRLMLCRITRPLSTTRRMLLVFPPMAEHRRDLSTLLHEMKFLARQAGAELRVYIAEDQADLIQRRIEKTTPTCPLSMARCATWGETRSCLFDDIEPDDMVVLLSERRSQVLWTPALDRLPGLVASRYPDINMIVTYPALLMSREDISPDAIASPPGLPRMYPTELPADLGIGDALHKAVTEAFHATPESIEEAFGLLMASAHLYPVEMADGTVLLHAHCAGISTPMLLVSHCRDGLAFPNLVSKPRVILALLSPKSSPPEEHLRTLAEIARKFHKPEIVFALSKADSAKAICDTLRD